MFRYPNTANAIAETTRIERDDVQYFDFLISCEDESSIPWSPYKQSIVVHLPLFARIVPFVGSPSHTTQLLWKYFEVLFLKYANRKSRLRC
jgi:hypothetical protein